jgi:hypothetical protein
MKFKSIALAGSAAIALTAGMMGASYASAASLDSSAVRQTQQLNKDELSRVAPSRAHHARHLRHEASYRTENNKSAENSKRSNSAAINPETGRTVGTTHSSAERLAAKVGNKVIRVMYTKRAPLTERDMSKGLPLDKVGKPTQTLSTAAVETENGYMLGEVKSVEVGSNGDPRTVNVVTGGFLGVGQHVVPIRANDLVYLPDRNLLVTSMTKKEVDTLPAKRSS